MIVGLDRVETPAFAPIRLQGPSCDYNRAPRYPWLDQARRNEVAASEQGSEWQETDRQGIGNSHGYTLDLRFVIDLRED